MREKITIIVDDEPDICDLIEDALEEIDITVWSASTAEEAINLAGHYVVDVFFIDIFMPGKGGLWLIEELRRLHPEATIIAMSGGFDSMSADKTMKAVEKIGIEYRLAKPFMVDDVLSIVIPILERDSNRPGKSEAHLPKH
jgi:DNA-binding NtrC family response regulator